MAGGGKGAGGSPPAPRDEIARRPARKGTTELFPPGAGAFSHDLGGPEVPVLPFPHFGEPGLPDVVERGVELDRPRDTAVALEAEEGIPACSRNGASLSSRR
jgi:hypothetical protein